MKRVIHWFRRDLRTSDNTALSQAARQAELVIPVFVLEAPSQAGVSVAAAQRTFLMRSLERLRSQLAALGYSLIVRRGSAEAELPMLCKETGAEAVFCNREYEPCAESRDNRMFNVLNGLGVGFEIHKDAVIWESRELLTKKDAPFTVFGPYAKAWAARKIPPPRSTLPPARTRIPKIACDPVPWGADELEPALRESLPSAGEDAGRETLLRFLRGPVFCYSKDRDYPGRQATSRLSTHLHVGTIGIRTVLAELAAARQGSSPNEQVSCDVFLKELIWREFYLQILANFPHVVQGSFRPEYDALEWSDDREHFQAWCAGLTGYPIVDAAMRCLNATGWMHNRLRMITAMFLTKDLLINWQWGERYFMQRLIDGDLAANNGGWQWSAGTGTDAAPYFRIFNPVAQGRRFDPDGIFVRQWLPELAPLPNDLIHSPWTQQGGERSIGYPQRVVQHEEQRKKCLSMYQRIRRQRISAALRV